MKPWSARAYRTYRRRCVAVDESEVPAGLSVMVITVPRSLARESWKVGSRRVGDNLDVATGERRLRFSTTKNLRNASSKDMRALMNCSRYWLKPTVL